MRVVVDTNIFISALMKADTAPRQIIRLCLLGILTPLMGNALFNEYEDVCSRPDLLKNAPLNDEDRQNLLNAFLKVCRWTQIYYLWRPNLKDEADNHVLELAIAGAAEYIITANKRDFSNTSLLFPDLKIATAAEFLNELRP